ncbi:uncharacterized protein [Solanum lycopersicum]|uniref:uncharacterized protein isoform X2 n=3 Tax=Solanum lycopersicum TaxID=4081 RepID=UPI0002BCBC6F|nr:uncharacterized protein LOC101257550 isoform X1 [Solanum lycopersicum]
MVGQKMQCTSYLPGYHPKVLNGGSLGGNSWSIQHNDIAWNGARGFYVSLPPFMADQNLELVHQKEILKQTMLKHEAIFRYQVNELHRVHRRQREVMEEIRRRKLVEDHLHLQALESKSFVSQLRSEISQKSNCQMVLDLTSIEPSTLCGETFQGSSNSIAGQRVPSSSDLLAEQNVTKERKISSSKSGASRKRMLDLELPAEEYMDIEDGEQFVRESFVQGPNIVISELQPQDSSKVNFANPGDSSISNSSPRGSFLLFDLNEPIQLDETEYPNYALESVNIHEGISNMDQDLSGTVHAECSTLKKEATGGDISNMNSSDEVSSVEMTLPQCNQTASSSPGFVDKSNNGTRTDKSLLVSSRKKMEIPFAVQALPCFITSSSLSKSPNSSVGNSSLTGKKSDLYNSSASSPTSGTSGSCLMKYGDNESTSGKPDAVKLSNISDSMSLMKGMDLNCAPSADLSDNQFTTPTSNISHLNLPEGVERKICGTVLLDCILSPDSAVESGKSSRDSHFVGPGSDIKFLTTNSCINMSCIKDETFSSGHSEATMTPVDGNLEAPIGPENKESSPPRGDSLDKTIGKSVQWSKIDHMNDHAGKTDRAAAEILLFISSSRGNSKIAKGGPSEASHDTLGLLADIATSLASNHEKAIGEFTNLHCHRSTLISDRSNCNEILKLTRKGGKEKEAVCNTMHSRTRRSQPRRANYRRVLQTEIHPAGASVYLHQFNGGLESPATAASESGPSRKTPRRACSRSRRWSPIAIRTTCSLLQPHPSNDKQGISEGDWKGWGLTKERQNSRRPRSISSFS